MMSKDLTWCLGNLFGLSERPHSGMFKSSAELDYTQFNF